MRDTIRRHFRYSLLALLLALSVAAATDLYAGTRIGGRLLLNGFAFWGGMAGAVVSLGWLAAIIGAYRILDGKETVAAWLEHERLQTVTPGFGMSLLSAWMLLTAEELLLRGVLLPLAGGLAIVAAVGLWRWQEGRRSTLWGMAHALLITSVALLSGNLIAAWLTHGLTETVWRGYLLSATWRERREDVPARGTGALGQG